MRNLLLAIVLLGAFGGQAETIALECEQFKKLDGSCKFRKSGETARSSTNN